MTVTIPSILIEVGSWKDQEAHEVY